MKIHIVDPALNRLVQNYDSLVHKFGHAVTDDIDFCFTVLHGADKAQDLVKFSFPKTIFCNSALSMMCMKINPDLGLFINIQDRDNSEMDQIAFISKLEKLCHNFNIGDCSV